MQKLGPRGKHRANGLAALPQRCPIAVLPDFLPDRVSLPAEFPKISGFSPFTDALSSRIMRYDEAGQSVPKYKRKWEMISMAVPKAMQDKYDEIAGLLIPYCDEYLSEEYKKLCLHALEKLCRKRPSPLLSGKARTWAAGIVYAVASNNFIFDRSQPIHYTAEKLAEPFGIAKSTMSNKGSEIKKMLKIEIFDSEWMLESSIESNPMVWMVSVGPYGVPVDARALPLHLQMEAAERGLIPYVPALRELEQMVEGEAKAQKTSEEEQ